MRLKDGIAVSNCMLGLTFHNFGNLLISLNKRKKSSELVYFKLKEHSRDGLNEGNYARILRIVDDVNRGRINYVR